MNSINLVAIEKKLRIVLYFIYSNILKELEYDIGLIEY